MTAFVPWELWPRTPLIRRRSQTLDVDSQKEVWSYAGNCWEMSFSKETRSVPADGWIGDAFFPKRCSRRRPAIRRPLRVRWVTSALSISGRRSEPAGEPTWPRAARTELFRVWKASDGSKQRRALAGHRAPVFAGGLRRSAARYLASVGRDRTLRDLESEASARHRMLAAASTSAGRLLISGIAYSGGWYASSRRPIHVRVPVLP